MPGIDILSIAQKAFFPFHPKSYPAMCPRLTPVPERKLAQKNSFKLQKTYFFTFFLPLFSRRPTKIAPFCNDTI